MTEPLAERPHRTVRKQQSILWRPLIWGGLIALAFWVGAHWRDVAQFGQQVFGEASSSESRPASSQAEPVAPSSGGSPSETTALTTNQTPSPAGALVPQAPIERPPGAFTDAETRTIELFRSASPSVVNIDALEQRVDRFSMRVFEVPRGSGSGIVWDERGHIVTNYHVVSDRRGRPLRARVTLHDQSVWDERR